MSSCHRSKTWGPKPSLAAKTGAIGGPNFHLVWSSLSNWGFSGVSSAVGPDLNRPGAGREPEVEFDQMRMRTQFMFRKSK